MSTIVARLPNGRNGGHDLTGRRFGKLTAVGPTGARRHTYRMWRTRCDCGREVEFYSYQLMRGIKDNCGCAPRPLGRPRIPNGGAHVNTLFGHYRQSARERGIAFRLTKEEARELFSLACFYCGEEPSVSYTHSNLSGSFAWNGIDRVDPAGGYEVSNCRPCCRRCNFAKGVMGGKEFALWVARVYRHLGLGKG